MKTKYYIAPAVALAALAAACSDEGVEQSPEGNIVIGNDHIVATFGNATRTQLVEEVVDSKKVGKVVWTKEDAITVFSMKQSNSTYTFSSSTYTLDGEAGTAEGTFTGALSTGATKVAALYPKSTSASLTSTISDESVTYAINYTMPATLKQSDLEGYLNQAPMAGLFGTDNQEAIAFKNPGALIDLTVYNVPTTYNYIALKSEGTAAKSINGDMVITFDANGVPTMAPTTANTATENLTTKITWENDADNLDDVQTVHVIIPVPVGTYTLVAYLGGKTEGKELELINLGAKEIKRNVRYVRSVTLDEVTGTLSKKVENLSAIAAALTASETTEEATNSVEVTTTISASETADNKIVLPANQTVASSTAAGEDPVKITLSSVESGASLTVGEATNKATNMAVSGDVTIAIAAVAKTDASEETPVVENLTLNLENSTVTLAPVSVTETVKYKKVVASTSENTLKVGNGVTIEDLTIAKGNVLVMGGGKIDKVSLTGNATSAIVYYEGEASDIKTADNGITLKPAEDYYFANGGTMTLYRDLERSEKFELYQKELKINLNGHNITSTGDFMRVAFGKLSIYGQGTITGCKYGLYVYSSTVSIGEGVTITETQNTAEALTAHAALYICNQGKALTEQRLATPITLALC
jgi:hypothetical protein